MFELTEPVYHIEVIMKKNFVIIAATAILLGAVLYLQAKPEPSQEPPKASGQLVEGFRVLSVAANKQPVHLVVYRGDYIKFDVDRAIVDPWLKIPALGIDQRLEGAGSQAPYFKMKDAGQFDFSLGGVTGSIDVVAYNPSNYAEVDAKAAAALISSRKPLVLDVRSPGEYQQGHLQGSVLIPVQELQKRVNELSAYKEREILVYCATGNRSTVASKILIDNGFQHITNLRHGIAGWARDNLPITR
jgi:rhodanese-related sulfurtransferase